MAHWIDTLKEDVAMAKLHIDDLKSGRATFKAGHPEVDISEQMATNYKRLVVHLEAIIARHEKGE